MKRLKLQRLLGAAAVGLLCSSIAFGQALTFTPAVLSGGSVGSPYSHTLIGSGGTPPYSTPTVVSGALPPGTTLGPGTVTFNFTPAVSVSFAFTLSMTDSGGGSVT